MSAHRSDRKVRPQPTSQKCLPRVEGLEERAVPAGLAAYGSESNGPARVRAFDITTGVEKFNFLPYGPSYGGGVRVAVGDVTGDGILDIITAPSNYAPDIRVWDGASVGLTPTLVTQFFAYANYNDGAYVAVGQFDGDAALELVTGPNSANPDIRIWDVTMASPPTSPPSGTATLKTQFFAGPLGSGGARVATGQFVPGGLDEILFGNTAGRPVLRTFTATPTFDPLTGFAPLQTYQPFDTTFNNGAYVAAGDLNGDGTADIVAGAARSPFSGSRVMAISGADGSILADFVPYANYGGTVRLAVYDADPVNPGLEIVTGANTNSDVRVFSKTGAFLSTTHPFPGGGVYVAGRN